MYRDLDPNIWPDVATHKLVVDLFEGTKTTEIKRAEEFSIDSDELKHEVPHLITDADSSQHSALIHALRGSNLVLEGPPGTGKSQTITNLIAAAISRGKTVLFVSEKLAALEVVRRRLDEAGLGHFCLELHSHKTKKDALLADLAARIRVHGSFKDPSQLDNELQTLEQRKNALSRYANLINKRVQPINLTIFELIWARERFHRELPFDDEIVRHALLPSMTGINSAEISQIEQLLSAYSQHLSRVLSANAAVHQHPWSWIESPLTFTDEITIGNLLIELRQIIAGINRSLSALSTTGIVIASAVSELRTVTITLLALPQYPDNMIPKLLPALRDSHNRQALTKYIEASVESKKVLGVLEKAARNGSVANLLRPDCLEALLQTANDLRSLKLGKHTLSELRALRQNTQTLAASIEEAERQFNHLQSILNTSARFEPSSIDLLLNTLNLLQTAPQDALQFRSRRLEAEGMTSAIRNSARESETLVRKRQELSEKFDLSVPIDSLKCSNHASVLEKTGFFRRWIAADYREAKRCYRSIARDPKRVSSRFTALAFRRLGQFLEQQEAFGVNEQCRSVFGGTFKGIDTPWDRIFPVLDWYDEIFSRLPENIPDAAQFRDVLLTARAETVRALIRTIAAQDNLIGGLKSFRSEVDQARQAAPLANENVSSIEEIREGLGNASELMARTIRILDDASVREDIPLGTVSELAALLKTYHGKVEEVTANRVATELLQGFTAQTKNDIVAITASLEFAEALSSTHIPRETVHWVLCEESAARTASLRALLVETVSHLSNLEERLQSVKSLAASDRLHGELIHELDAQLERALQQREELAQWLQFRRIRNEVNGVGLNSLITLAETGRVGSDQLLPAFRFCLYNTLVRSAFSEHSALSEVNGITQQETRKRFAESDVKTIQLYRQRVSSIADKRQVPVGNQSGPVGTWTELCLITHETAKQKRPLPSG